MKLKRYISRYLSWSRYFSHVDFSEFKLNVLEFRHIRLSDRIDMQYEEWSRVFEYPLVIDKIEQFTNGNDIAVHNSSWGFNACHIIFKDVLESKFSKVVNSDLLVSDVPNTEIWDLTTPPPSSYLNQFDAVINVSTVEEVDTDHLLILHHLLQQVKSGGVLIVTFDLPGMQLNKLEKLFNQTIIKFDDNLNGSNSPVPNAKYSGLTCGLLVIRKES